MGIEKKGKIMVTYLSHMLIYFTIHMLIYFAIIVGSKSVTEDKTELQSRPKND